ncbi:MAG: hypothetical protein ABIH34_07060 [Nanoarchaeota archaeon]
MSLDNLLHQDEADDNIEQKVRQPSSPGGFWGKIGPFSLPDYIGMAATTAFGFMFGGGLINLVSTTGSYILGTALAKKGKMDSQELKEEVNLGNTITGLLYPIYRWLDAIPNPITKSIAGLGIAMPSVIAAVTGFKKIYSDYTPPKIAQKIASGEILNAPRDMYETFKKDYLTTLKESYKWLTLPLIGVWNFVPLKWMLPATAAVRTGFRFLTHKVIEEKENGEEKTPQQNYRMPQRPYGRQPKYA